jgi:hypothetical protein
MSESAIRLRQLPLRPQYTADQVETPSSLVLTARRAPLTGRSEESKGHEKERGEGGGTAHQAKTFPSDLLGLRMRGSEKR